MPGFELIGKEEHDELNHLMNSSSILFRHGFDGLRNGVYKVRDFEKAFAEKMRSENALAVSSGTAALLVALKAFGIGKGDEVITQSFTFVATVEAIVEAGASPVIAEIDHSLNISPEAIEELITPATKAIIVVHMLGIPVDMDKVNRIAKKYNLYVIEDTAWGCGGRLNNQSLGTLSDAGTYSFDFAKTMTTGEGGMVVFKDHQFFQKAAAYHDHGHENNPDFPRWEDTRSSTGFNYRMSELQGAIGLAQLRKLDGIVTSQRFNAKRIADSLVSKGYKLREKPNNSYETSDAVVFFCQNAYEAVWTREKLLKVGISTKILPEAISWHFAGSWDHIPEIKNFDSTNRFALSHAILSKTVAIPIFVNMEESFFEKIEQVL
jgi:8-amino-3,8-dideoxy-alpha-D-manno-octulosonate transaminase